MTAPFLDLVNLAAARLGASVVAANDEFFGGKDRLIDAKAPIWLEDRYTDRGKWMDGWETRRRREPGHDWCVVRLGVPGVVRGVNVETTFFRGNFPEACAIDVCDEPERVDGWTTADWREILPRAPLQGDTHNPFAADSARRCSHVRLRIFPDGGVARLRVYGDVVADWPRLRSRGEVDLAALEHGGFVVACSDMFFGHRQHLIMPGEARTMAEGWETRRRRGGGHDWTIIRLGAPGSIARAEIDTRHFKGNAPGSSSLEASTGAGDPTAPDTEWRELMAQTALQPDARHVFDSTLAPIDRTTFVRLNIFPDGGVSRLRLFGRPS